MNELKPGTKVRDIANVGGKVMGYLGDTYFVEWSIGFRSRIHRKDLREDKKHGQACLFPEVPEMPICGP